MIHKYLLLIILLTPLALANGYVVSVEQGEIVDVQRTMHQPIQQPEGDSQLQLLDANNQVLHTARVQLSNSIIEPFADRFSQETYEEGVNGEFIEKQKYVYEGQPLLVNTQQQFYISYHPQATTVRLQRTSPLSPLTYDVTQQSNSCGNNICGAHQTWFSCPQDCQMPIQYDENSEHVVGDQKIRGQYEVVYGSQACSGEITCVQYTNEGTEIKHMGSWIEISDEQDNVIVRVQPTAQSDGGAVITRGDWMANFLGEGSTQTVNMLSTFGQRASEYIDVDPSCGSECTYTLNAPLGNWNFMLQAGQVGADPNTEYDDINQLLSQTGQGFVFGVQGKLPWQ